MSMAGLKKQILRNLSNVPGWRTNRKILVIESDDWGSIRMPSRETYERLKKAGLDVSGSSAIYNLYDTLASTDDLNALFELLDSFRDKNNNPAVFTAICIVANPDFHKIKECQFTDYFYEPFNETLYRYFQSDKPFETWKKGIDNHLFIPQFHGREHLNVALWMRDLLKGNKEAHLGFEHEVWGFKKKPDKNSTDSYLAAFDLYYPGDISIQAKAIKEGLMLFNELFGYKATFFVPPNGPFNSKLEKVTAENGIKYISTSKIQLEPKGFRKNTSVFHWLGQRNTFDQRYMVRNCFFEPSQEKRNWVDTCLQEIAISFRWNKPAVISSHRINYIGVHDVSNRDNGLRQLKILLTSVLKNWPDVEFMTSDQLGRLITNEDAK